jgi:hypothetical protein
VKRMLRGHRREETRRFSPVAHTGASRATSARQHNRTRRVASRAKPVTSAFRSFELNSTTAGEMTYHRSFSLRQERALLARCAAAIVRPLPAYVLLRSTDAL